MKRSFYLCAEGLGMNKALKRLANKVEVITRKEVKMLRKTKYLLVIPAILIISGCATTPKDDSNSFDYDYFTQYQYEHKEVPNAVLSGSVRGKTGLPLRARITFMGTNVNSIDTGISGKFTTTLPLGTYTVRAEAEGFLPEEKYITLRPNETRPVNFVLRHKNP